MKLAAVRSFLEIVSLESFSKAALSLHYAHSTVTAQIKSLESELGEQLFYRDNKTVVISEAGKRFLPYARQLIDLEKDAKLATHDSPVLHGQLKIAAVETVSTYRLPIWLKKLRTEAPDIKISFQVMRDQEILESVRTGTLDFGFMVEEKIQVKDIEVNKLYKEKVSLYAHPKNSLAKKNKVTAKDLSKQFHLLWSLGCSYSNVFNDLMQKAGYHDFRYMEFSNTESMKQCVLENIGIATLTDITVAKEVLEGKIKRLNFDFPQRFNSMMLTNTHRRNRPLIQYFRELICDDISMTKKLA